MPGGPGRRLLAAALIVTALGAAACGSRVGLPTAATGKTSGAGPAGPGSAGSGGASAGTPGTSSTSPVGSSPSGSVSPGPSANTTVPPVGPAANAITSAYETYLHELSQLDDTLSKAYIGPLAAVTTNRLAQASVRQAAALLGAQEHAVGSLQDDHIAITMTSSTSAALADCQDEEHFYLVGDSGTPDSFVQRGYFVGSAQLVLQGGRWLVDTFTTTHVPCTF